MISVIIPTYNRENLIVRSAKSVLAQTYEDLELIIVDDGSTDNTQSVVKSIDDSRVSYVKLPHGKGAPAARNYGVLIAKGEYVAFQDSDDIWMPEKLDKQLAFLRCHDADVVACTFMAEDGSAIQYWGNFSDSRQVSFLDLFPGNIISTQTILGKKECFLNYPFDVDFPRLQDWDLVIRLVQKYRFFLDTEPLVKVCFQGERISSDYKKYYIGINMIFKKILNMPTGNEQKEALSRLFDAAYRESINREERLHYYEARCQGYEERLHYYEARCQGYEERLQNNEARCQGYEERLQYNEARCQGYEERLQYNETHCQGYEERLQYYEARCQGYEERLQYYEARCQGYEEKLQYYEARCQSYESSKSWRITKPLRDFMNFLRQHARRHQ